MGKGLFFWLGAEADLGASSGSSSLRSPEPVPVSAHSGDDPARKALESAAQEILKIPIEVVEKHLDRAYVIISHALAQCPTCARPSPTEWR